MKQGVQLQLQLKYKLVLMSAILTLQIDKSIEEKNRDPFENFIKDLFEPFRVFTRTHASEILCVSLGAMMVRQGAMDASALVSFYQMATSFRAGWTNFRKKVEKLYSLEDPKLLKGHQLMATLSYEPVIGIHGGWQPSPAQKRHTDELHAKEANQLVADTVSATIVPARDIVEGKSDTNQPQPETRSLASLKVVESSDAAHPRNHLNVDGTIEFKNVTFSYPGEPRPTLRDINFVLPTGSFVGICGKSGNGKTTLFRLIHRLYDPSHGEIWVGGRPLKDYNAPYIRSQIGLCEQIPYVDQCTIRENLVLGSKQYLKRKYAKPEMIDAVIKVHLTQNVLITIFIHGSIIYFMPLIVQKSIFNCHSTLSRTRSRRPVAGMISPT